MARRRKVDSIMPPSGSESYVVWTCLKEGTMRLRSREGPYTSFAEAVKVARAMFEQPNIEYATVSDEHQMLFQVDKKGELYFMPDP